MAFWVVNLPTLTMSSSASNAIPLEDTYAISIQSPVTLTASQATVQVSMTSSGTTDFPNLLSAGANVVIPANSAIVISPAPFKQMMLISTTNEAATRTFLVTKAIVT